MKRILSIDILRGITVAGMILVNNPGASGSQYAPLKHALWNGMTPTDLVFPFFLFIMGISGYFSLSKRLDAGFGTTILHVFKRSVMIFLVGTILQMVSMMAGGNFDFSTYRIMGVLQSLAFTYLFGSAIMMGLKFRHMVPVALAVLAGYSVLLLCGNGFSLSTDNIIAKVDAFILGEGHLYSLRTLEGGRIPFDPEGIVSLIPKISHYLLGAFLGKIIIDGRGKEYAALSNILLFGAFSLMSGYLLQYGLPLNKMVWSPSFVLVTSGYASLLLGVLMWVIDIKGKKQWTGFFGVFGTNPLFLYCLAWVFSILMRTGIPTADGVITVKNLFFSTCIGPYLGVQFGSLVYSILFVSLVWLVGLPLYRKHIYIKL